MGKKPAYSNEKPGVPTETPGYKTNPLTLVVIIWVVVICPLAGHSGRLFVYSVYFLFIFVNVQCESYFRVHRFDFALHDEDDFDKAPG